MTRAELARALQVVDYGLRAPATTHLPGYHRGLFHGAAGRLKGFTSLLHRMDPKSIDPVTTRRALSPVPLVRLYQAKVAITVTALLDLSASMGFAGRSRKMAEAAKLAACLAYSAYRLGDRFGLIGFGDGVELFFPPKRSPDYPLEIGELLWSYAPESRTADGLAQAVALVPRRRSLVFLVSDFHFGRATLDAALAALRPHDVVLTALWDDAEGADPLQAGWTEWADPETGERARLWLRAGLRRRFRRAFESRRAAITESAGRFGAEAIFVRNRFDPAELTRLFAARKG